MEEDEDADETAKIKMVELQIELERLKTAKRAKEAAAKSAAAAAATTVPEAAKTEQDEKSRADAKKTAARAEKEKAAAVERTARAEAEKEAERAEAEKEAARAESDKTKKAQRDKAHEEEVEALRLEALAVPKTQHQLPLGGFKGGQTDTKSGWNQQQAEQNTGAHRAINNLNKERRDQLKEDLKLTSRLATVSG